VPVSTSKLYAGFYQHLNTSQAMKRAPGQVIDPDLDPVHPNPSPMHVDRLPKIGSYRITLTITDQTKSRVGSLTVTNTITLKNIITACIGDSFNAGEGNPDDVSSVFPPCQSDINQGIISLLSAGLDVYLGSEIPFYTQVKNFLESKKKEFDPDVPDPDIWYEPKAHRSLLSGPARAARYMEDIDPHSAVTFIDFASTGATIERGLIKPQRQWQKKGSLKN
jgi:hypothetical protein